MHIDLRSNPFLLDYEPSKLFTDYLEVVWGFELSFGETSDVIATGVSAITYGKG